MAVTGRVLIDNKASATHTVVEVTGRDRPGFLYLVTGALTALKLQISSAKISTFGVHAVDVFYVKDQFGLKIESEARLAQMREHLLAALAEGTYPRVGRRAYSASRVIPLLEVSGGMP